MKHAIRLLFGCLTVLICLSGCEKNSIPVIQTVAFFEESPGVLTALAKIEAKEVDEWGICYSKSNTSPTLDKNDGIIYGTTDDGKYTTSFTLDVATTYYLVVFATNEMGTTHSASTKLTTSASAPDADDNPLPHL